MTFGGRKLQETSPSPLGSLARVLTKQEEAVAAAGKVGVALLPPLAWGLRISARTWERWSQLGMEREEQAHADWAQTLFWCPPRTQLGCRKRKIRHRGPMGYSACCPQSCFIFFLFISGTTGGHELEMEHKMRLSPRIVSAGPGSK